MFVIYLSLFSQAIVNFLRRHVIWNRSPIDYRLSCIWLSFLSSSHGDGYMARFQKKANLTEKQQQQQMQKEIKYFYTWLDMINVRKEMLLKFLLDCNRPIDIYNIDNPIFFWLLWMIHRVVLKEVKKLSLNILKLK